MPVRSTFPSGWVLLGLLLMGGAATGCRENSPKREGPTFLERKAQRPWATSTSLEQGRKLHQERCLTCHGQAPRELYDADRWAKIVGSMAERSGLDSTESRLVLDWILVGDSLEHP